MEDIKLNNKPKSKKPFSKHKLLWGLGAGLGATLLTAAIVTPIVVYPGFKPAVDPTVDFEQGSSTDVSVKSKNIALNKESTITLNIAPGKELDTNPDSIKVSVGNVKLVRSLQYDVNYETKVITIKAEAMSSIHVQLKVVTKNIAYGFNVNLGAGITSWSSSTLSPKYHEKVVIECNVYDRYVFDQRILNTDATKGIQIKVGNRTLTSTNDVIVDADKSTITINEGVIDGDVSITGDIQLYEVSFSCDDHFKSVIEDSVASYQYIKDFVYPFELKDGCIDPSVSISSSNDKSETNTLDVGTDFNLVKQLSDKCRYNYHLNFTESGRKKIIGPVSVYFSASKADEIKFKNIASNSYSFALGTTSPISFEAVYLENGAEKDAEVYANCGTTGYTFDETSKTLIPGANVKEGQIQLTAIHDNVYKDLTVNVVKPSVKFEIKDTEWEKKVLSKSELEETHKYSISSTITPEIPGEDVTYEWSSSDDTKIKVESTTKDAEIDALSYSDNKAVTLTLKVKLNGNEITSKSIDLKVIKQLFEHTSWTQIVQYINEFESSGQDEEAQKTLCSYFSDTPYIKDISSEITDPDKQIEAHLASFINKEHEISYDKDITDNVRIIGINHDTIADGSNKKATFTFEAKHLVSSSDNSGKALKSVWDAEKNSDYTNSVLNWNLNGTGSPADHATKWSTPLINLIKDIDGSIKKVNKQVAQYDTAGKAWNVNDYGAQLFPLSVAEMGINDTVHAKVEGSAYKFWKDVAKPADWIKTPKVIDDSDQDHYDCHYWLVSPSIDPDYDYISWLVNDSGIADYSKPSTFPGNKGIGVSFAFCI